MPELNKKLWRKVKRHILEEPRRFDQTTSGSKVSKRQSPCGTRACIGGWADMLEGDDAPGPYSTDMRRARIKLGLTPEQSYVVFYGQWPEPFNKAWDSNLSRVKAARLAADYINYILRTGKVT